jgi:hypothetical protein
MCVCGASVAQTGVRTTASADGTRACDPRCVCVFRFPSGRPSVCVCVGGGGRVSTYANSAKNIVNKAVVNEDANARIIRGADLHACAPWPRRAECRH